MSFCVSFCIIVKLSELGDEPISEAETLLFNATTRSRFHFNYRTNTLYPKTASPLLRSLLTITIVTSSHKCKCPIFVPSHKKNAMPVSMDFEKYLMSLYNKMIPDAESLFGRKIPGIPVKRIYLHRAAPMMIPDRVDSNLSVKIALNEACESDEYRLKLQLSHEAAHSLWPSGETFTNWLDEGVAVYFSLYYLFLYPSTYNYGNRVIAHMQGGEDQTYYRAYQIVHRLLSREPGAIKRIRSVNTYIGRVTKPELVSLNLELSEEELDLLTRRFIYET